MTTALQPESGFSPFSFAMGAWEYGLDALQRSVLFWDVQRQRGNRYLQHIEEGKPPVLQFEYDTIVDGRTMQRPTNYSLLRIKPPEGIRIDSAKRPYVIVDPRAGHGPGIGGMKQDSQVGMAVRAGHPVYFVTFAPEPVPGQKLADVAWAEGQFIEEVVRRHPKSDKPCLIGNCQAGWAVAALASVRPDLMGPVILNGAPLNYWSGASGKNPMRYSGGLLGGKWMESLACDLGAGLFDGAHLVANFIHLDPGNEFWTKKYNLYAHIDTEPARYLDFETWFSGYFLMNAEEIDAIVGDLFIGNKLATGQIRGRGGEALDLRNIRSPIVIFCSQGDNITPPQQALDWIEDVYGTEQAIIDNDQVIIYMLHKDIGHLGIFVSGKVAKKEQRELVNTLDMIDALPPGLYQMIVEEKTPAARRADVEPGEYLVRFESRRMDDIRSMDESRQKEEGYFQSVNAASQIYDGLYKALVRPWLRSMITPQAARWLRELHPLRVDHVAMSDRNSALALLPPVAGFVRAHRKPAAQTNPWLSVERMASDWITAALDIYCDQRDIACEGIFKLLYGPFGWGAIFPPQAMPASQPLPHGEAPSIGPEQFEMGGPGIAVLRIIAAAGLESGVFDRRWVRIGQVLVQRSKFKDVEPRRIRQLFKDQVKLLRHDPGRAMDTLAVLLPTPEVRIKALKAVGEILMLLPEDIHMDRPLASRLSQVLGVDLPKLAAGGNGAAHVSTAKQSRMKQSRGAPQAGRANRRRAAARA